MYVLFNVMSVRLMSIFHAGFFNFTSWLFIIQTITEIITQFRVIKYFLFILPFFLLFKRAKITWWSIKLIISNYYFTLTPSQTKEQNVIIWYLDLYSPVQFSLTTGKTENNVILISNASFSLYGTLILSILFFSFLAFIFLCK